MTQLGSQLGPQLDASALQPGIPGTRGVKPGSPRLAHAAVEFESVLLGQWIESAQKSFATVPGGDDADGDAGGEQMLSFAMQQLAHAIASKGGLGIAKIVQQGLEHAANAGAENATAAALSASDAKRPARP